jgi:PAS domain S-box-containing protein
MSEWQAAPDPYPGAALPFEGIIDTALDAVVVMDREGLIRGWNRQAELSFGWPRAAVMGRRLSETIIPARYRQAHEDGLRRFLEAGEGPVLGQILELSAQRASGEEFPVELAISPPYGAGAEVIFVGFIRDITSRVNIVQQAERQRETEAEALRARRAAEVAQTRQHALRMAELERLKTEFMKLASHELRGPLTVIRGYLSMLTDGSLTEAADVLAVITAKANQMNLLLNQMLEVARLEEGGLRLTLRRHDLRELFSEAFKLVEPLAGRDHRLTLELPDQPCTAMVDANRFRTMVGGLIENAIKYSPDGGPITCRLVTADGAAEVSVVDRGVGVSPEDMPRLFTRFGRIVTPDNSHIDGSGLGLYLCREIALLHGGEIAAESSPRLGTTIRLTLPLAEAAESDAGDRVLRLAGQRHDIEDIDAAAAVRLSRDLQRAAAGATGLGASALAVVGYLYENLSAGVTGPAACALVRFYRTQPLGLLSAEEVEFARRAAPGVRLAPEVKCLELVATVGDDPKWNSPRDSAGHRVIPLPGEAALNRLPMVSQLVRQLGLDVGALLSADPYLLVDVAPKTYNVFYIAEAEGSPYVPAQDFVREHGIRSVIGFGGLFGTGEMFAVIMFTRVLVSPRSASMFRVVAHAVKQSAEPQPG